MHSVADTESTPVLVVGGGPAGIDIGTAAGLHLVRAGI